MYLPMNSTSSHHPQDSDSVAESRSAQNGTPSRDGTGSRQVGCCRNGVAWGVATFLDVFRCIWICSYVFLVYFNYNNYMLIFMDTFYICLSIY